jgi:hypothetical protein
LFLVSEWPREYAASLIPNSIQNLYLDNNLLDGDVCDFLAYLTRSVRTLSLANNSFTSDSCVVSSSNTIMSLDTLSLLDLSNNRGLNLRFTRTSMQSIAPNLQLLNIHSTAISLAPATADDSSATASSLLPDPNTGMTCPSQWPCPGLAGCAVAASPEFFQFVSCFCTTENLVWSAVENTCVACPASATCSARTSAGCQVPQGVCS